MSFSKYYLCSLNLAVVVIHLLCCDRSLLTNQPSHLEIKQCCCAASVGANSHAPPYRSDHNSLGNSIAGDSNPGSHRSSIDLDNEALQEHFLEDSMAVLYPPQGISMDAMFQNKNTGGEARDRRRNALLSVPVAAMQRHSRSHSGDFAESDAPRRGYSSSGVHRGSSTSGRGSAAGSLGGRGPGGHTRAASYAPPQSSARRGSQTSRPGLGGHSRSKSGGVGVLAQRPAWGVRNEPSVAAKRASLQSIHSAYSVSNKASSLRTGGSAGGGRHSTHNTFGKSALHTGVSAMGDIYSDNTGVGANHHTPGSMSHRASPAAQAQRARADAKLESQSRRGPNFGTPVARGGQGGKPRSGAGRRTPGLKSRRPSTARPASASSPSPLQSACGSKLPSNANMNITGNKLRSGTSAASIRSTASGSSRIAAVPAHAMSNAANARGPNHTRTASARVGTGANRTGTNRNSSSAANIQTHKPGAQGSMNISDNMFGSVDHVVDIDILSGVLSSELPNSPSGISDSSNPFLPMMPAAQIGGIFAGISGQNRKAEKQPSRHEDTPPAGGKIFQNVTPGSGNLDGSQKLSQASSQFVRGKLAAGLTSPEPKGGSHMHGVANVTHDDEGAAVVHAMNSQEDLHIDDIGARLQNPQVRNDLPLLSLHRLAVKFQQRCTLSRCTM